MSKGLEALERIKLVYDSTDIPIIEKELKALEIIKSKELNVFFIKRYTLEDFNYMCRYEQQLTQEEYDLLNEVLL